MRYTHSYLLNQKDDRIFYSSGNYVGKGLILLKSVLKRSAEILSAEKYDIVFVQRECFMLGTSFFEKYFSKKGKLVFDFDDSIWFQNVTSNNKNLAWLKDPLKTDKIIRFADMVFAGNEYLADHARQFNSNVIIVPTTIDTDEYRPKPSKEANAKVCIGWSGSFSTIEHFEIILPVLRKMKEKYGDKIYFKVIGDKNYANPALGIKGIGWSKEGELEELGELDIGIMPLPNDEWAKGKCGLKGLQYMALEIPTIMSPVGVNSDIIKDGENGFLAEGEQEWMDRLSALVEDASLRNRLGKNGRKTVVDKYSVLSLREKYVSYFLQLGAGKEVATTQ